MSSTAVPRRRARRLAPVLVVALALSGGAAATAPAAEARTKQLSSGTSTDGVFGITARKVH